MQSKVVRRKPTKSAGAKPALPVDASPALTEAELRVLATFRRFLMRPGQMLCFGGQEFETWGRTLSHMSRKGLVVAERAPRAFSLTPLGFACMRRL